MHETETRTYYHNSTRYHVDKNGAVILETKTPVCMNYSPFDDTCISECTWCDNPYHCKYKNVSRETFMTIHELPLFIISLDICWNCFDCYGCDDTCTHDVSADMTALSIIMILRGDY